VESTVFRLSRDDSSELRKPSSFSEWTISADDVDVSIARAIRICVGNHIKKMYGDLLKEPLPPKIAELLGRLED
jgi:hypothetical protein